MCLICVELSKNKLTPLEARRNLGEMVNIIKKEHRMEVLHAIWEKEDELNKLDEPLSENDDWYWGSD